jgi:hypothetical protein
MAINMAQLLKDENYLAAAATIDQRILAAEKNAYKKMEAELAVKPQTYRDEIELTLIRTYNGYMFGQTLYKHTSNSWLDASQVAKTVWRTLKDATEGTTLQKEHDAKMAKLLLDYQDLEKRYKTLQKSALLPDKLTVVPPKTTKTWTADRDKLNLPQKPADFISATETGTGSYLILPEKGNPVAFELDSDGKPTAWSWSHKNEGLQLETVKITTDGGFFIGAYDSVLKFDKNYKFAWQNYAGNSSTSSGEDHICYHTEQSSDGGYICAGMLRNSKYQLKGLALVKFDTDGNKKWGNIYQDSMVGSGNEEGYSVQQTSDGGYVAAGTTGPNGYDVLLVKTDGSGSTQWTKTFQCGGADTAFSVKATSDGGYLIVQKTTIAKTDSSGEIK